MIREVVCYHINFNGKNYKVQSNKSSVEVLKGLIGGILRVHSKGITIKRIRGRIPPMIRLRICNVTYTDKDKNNVSLNYAYWVDRVVSI